MSFSLPGTDLYYLPRDDLAPEKPPNSSAAMRLRVMTRLLMTRLKAC